MGQPKLTFFVDIVSPFAYLAFHVLKNNETFKGLDIDYIPVFLGGIMQDTGNRPPMTIGNKGAWLMRERTRWLKRFNIPMADDMPNPFPQSTLQTGRALCVIKEKYPAKLEAAVAALYKAFFIDLKSAGKVEVIAEVLANGVLTSSEVESVMKAAQEPAFKQRLLDNTKLALDEGAFGLPYFVCISAKGEKDCFWGFDHLGQVIDHLGLERKGEGFRAML